MTTSLCSFLCLLTLGVSGNELVIDAMDYPNGPAARRAWTICPDAPPVAMVEDGGRRVLDVKAPFAARPKLTRVFVDRRVDLDLSVPGEFRLELSCDQPEVFNGITLYFRCGKGWYASNGGLVKRGWQTLTFAKSSFRAEGQPTGWHEIEQIRIAAWHGQSKDASLRLGRLTASWHNVVLVVPAGKTKEATDSRATARQMVAMLDEMKLGSNTIEEGALTGDALAKCRVAVLPYNPTLPAEAHDALVEFVQRGGKVFACYRLPHKLAEAIGFRSLKYIRPKREGRFAEIRFDARGIDGLPRSVRQASWNITTVEPVGYNARAIGHWFDDVGKPTGEGALWLSDRGAMFSHLILPDDREGKKRLLGAVLGHLSKPLWQEMAENALAQADHVGHCQNFDEVAAHGRDQQTPQAKSLLASAKQTLVKARKRLDAGGYYEAVQLARQGHGQLAEAYLRGQPSPTREARAWWNHSGTGVYPGDWDRTAKELSDAGFNMIVPNMLWGGVAHYESDILPRSSTYEKYGDQIAQCVAAAKEHGLEVHVWKVNHYLSARSPKEFVEKLRRAGRLQASVRGEEKDWLCPSHPENLKLELESMLEVVRKYDVDGLHFDYIRYPDHDYCYCAGCRKRFEAASGRKVEAWPDDCYSGERKEEYNDWRCLQITRLVAAVHREAKKLRGELKISAAVFGSYPACRASIAQDWVAWVKAGYVDFLCPMDYTPSDLAFRGRVRGQLRLVEGRVPLYPGIGATATGIQLSPDRVVGQIHHARSLGAGGFTIFDLNPKTAEAILPGVALGAGSQKAVPPHRDGR